MIPGEKNLRNFARFIQIVSIVLSLLRRQCATLEHRIDGRPRQIPGRFTVVETKQRRNVGEVGPRDLMVLTVHGVRLLHQIVQIQRMLEPQLRVSAQYGRNNTQTLDGDLTPFRLVDMMEHLLDEQRERQLTAAHRGERRMGGQMMSPDGDTERGAGQNVPDQVVKVIWDATQAALQLAQLKCCQPEENRTFIFIFPKPINQRELSKDLLFIASPFADGQNPLQQLSYFERRQIIHIGSLRPRNMKIKSHRFQHPTNPDL